MYFYQRTVARRVRYNDDPMYQYIYLYTECVPVNNFNNFICNGFYIIRTYNLNLYITITIS